MTEESIARRVRDLLDLGERPRASREPSRHDTDAGSRHRRTSFIDDAPEVRALAGEREIAKFIPLMPHPYEEGMAESWIARHGEAWQARREATFAICDAATGGLRGAIGLVGIDAVNSRAELGYWIAIPYWGQGLATEAAAATIAFAFDTLDLKRVFASAIAENAGSIRVLKKVGMRHEGRQRAHICRFGVTSDLELYGVLRSEA